MRLEIDNGVPWLAPWFCGLKIAAGSCLVGLAFIYMVSPSLAGTVGGPWGGIFSFLGIVALLGSAIIAWFATVGLVWTAIEREMRRQNKQVRVASQTRQHDPQRSVAEDSETEILRLEIDNGVPRLAPWVFGLKIAAFSCLVGLAFIRMDFPSLAGTGGGPGGGIFFFLGIVAFCGSPIIALVATVGLVWTAIERKIQRRQNKRVHVASQTR